MMLISMFKSSDHVDRLVDESFVLSKQQLSLRLLTIHMRCWSCWTFFWH